MKLAALALAAAIAMTAAAPPRVKRASVAAVEQSFDQRIRRLGDDPFILLGGARGLYLDGYGAVFTIEVNLFNGPALSPFRQIISKEDIARVHAKKIERMPLLRQNMRDMLLAAAASLDEVPAGEQIVVGISLLYQPYEDTSGLPGQIVMQAPKGKILDAKLGRGSLDAALKLQEY